MHVVTHLVLLWRVERIPQYCRGLYWRYNVLGLLQGRANWRRDQNLVGRGVPTNGMCFGRHEVPCVS